MESTIVATVREAAPEVLAVYLFGSEARDQAAAGGDVDVALLAPSPFGPERRFEIQQRLALALGRDVDLVDLRRASTVFAMQVIANARVLFDANADARGAFEDRTYGAYARLNEERRGILERVRREGTVYGR
jgi:predicted nucleotidyltransferase